ncbi:MAG: hypothetical protein ACI4J0_10615 [Huintestinicola sp.]|uniref:hypothetical protein n=1 Tax=Huintestinicola sp. TaxID=2981661 RepID=UPI003EFF3C7C
MTKNVKILLSGVFIIVIAALILAAAFLFSDEDFQPYVRKAMTFDGEPISGNAFVIDEIEASLGELANGIEPGMILAYAEYTFRSGDDIKSSFFYIKETDANRNATLHINVDAAKQTAVEAVFEEGIRKRVRLTFSRPLANNKDVDIFSEYLKCIDEINKSGREDLYGMPITITVTDEKIYRSVYSEDEGLTVIL